jgi:hypothetical protein
MDFNVEVLVLTERQRRGFEPAPWVSSAVVKLDVRRVVGWAYMVVGNEPCAKPILDSGVTLDYAVRQDSVAAVEARQRELAAPEKIVG